MPPCIVLVGQDASTAAEREQVRAWLEGEGYAVGAFEDPGAALTFIREAQPLAK